MDFDSFVLAAVTADLATEPRARDDADAVEFRMDLASDPVRALASYDGALPIIATNRVEGEGGEARDAPERLSALREAASTDAVGAIDVELSAIEAGPGADLVDDARAHDTAVIASFHDFGHTPPEDHLRDALRRTGSHGTVAKLAVTAQAPEDVLSLLRVTRERDAAGDRVATMAMGEVGRHSRAVAPLYGSRIGYAPVDPEDATAPGQYDLATLRSLVSSLEPR